MLSIRSSVIFNSSLKSSLRLSPRNASHISGRTTSTIFTLQKTNAFSCLQTSVMNNSTQSTKYKLITMTKRTLTSSGNSKNGGSLLQRWMAPKEMPERGSLKWYAEMVLICGVFAVTGTSTMVIVRPAISDVLGLKGSFKDGPWSYRICSLIVMTPLYSMMLVIVGTVAGRHAYFRHFAVKMFRRFGIPPELMDKNFHQNAKHFRKY